MVVFNSIPICGIRILVCETFSVNFITKEISLQPWILITYGIAKACTPSLQ